MRLPLTLTTLCLLAINLAFADTYVVGVQDFNYSPYYHIEKGQYEGFVKELIDAFGEEYGYQFEYRPMPIPRLYRMLLDGNIDFKFPDHPMWAQDVKGNRSIYYSKGLVNYVDGILVNQNAQPKQAVDVKVIGYVRGFAPWTLMDAIKQGKVQSREANSLQSLLKMLQANRIDGAYFNIKVAFQLNEMDQENKHLLRFEETLPHHRSSYRMSSLKYKTILEELSEFARSGKAKPIYDHYGLSVD